MKKILKIFIALLVLTINADYILAQQTVYSNGNVKIVQNTDGWRVLLGETVVGHGDGVLDVNDLPPAFQDLLNFYAEQKESSIKRSLKKSLKKSATAVYGPLLHTAWNQRTPYNNECPTITFYNETTEWTKQTITGCGTISSAQVMNYFGYCLPLNISGNGTTKNYSNIKSINSPYITSSEGYKFTYSLNYTPDFEKISINNSDLAKFIVGIAFAQEAILSYDETSTYPNKQTNAFNTVFGYDAVLYSNKDDSFINSEIISSIQKGWPIIIGGANSEGGRHSFIIDGYNGKEFHVDYGWGGKSNGWFTTTLYPDDTHIQVVHPNVSNATYMQQTPKYLVIDDKKVSMSQFGENILQYQQDETVSLKAGKHTFYFEYSDGSKLAPYTTSDIVLNDANKCYVKYGNYVSTSASINLSKDYNLDFYHNLGQGEVKIELSDANLTVSGKVLDENNNPVESAVVTTANAIPEPEVDCQNDGNFSSGYGVENTTIGFVPTKKILTGLGVYIWEKGSPTSNLTVSLVDKEMKVLQSVAFPKTEFSTTSKYLEINFEKPISVTAGQKYYISLSANYDDNNYYVCAALGENNYIYKVLGVDDYFTTTDEKGEYEISVSKYWTGSLNAFSGVKEFNTLTFNNITTNQSDKNFVQIGFAFPKISGKVLDKKSTAISGAVITVASTKPEPSIDCQRTTEINSGYYVNNSEFAIVPAKKYINKIEIRSWKNGTPNCDLEVSILNSNKNVLGTTTIPITSFNQNYIGWYTAEFDKLVCITPNETHYIRLSSDEKNAYCYAISVSGDASALTYKLYGVDDYYTTSDASGNYTYSVNKNWSGTLHAYSGSTKFNTLTFENIQSSKTGKNFKEGADDETIEATYSIVYIVDGLIYETSKDLAKDSDIPSVTAPTKSGYVFKGWTPALPEKMPEENLVVTGEWTQIITPTVELSATSFEYTGEEIKPVVIVKDGEEIISETEYIVSFSDNINVGNEAKVIITDNDGGDYAFEEITETFEITRAAVTVTAENKTKEYGENDPELTTTITGLKGEDNVVYTISRAEGENVGTYSITPTGNVEQGNYTVTFENAVFTITAKTITPTLELSATSFEYTGKEIKPTVTVKVGESTIPETEYTVAYSNNTNTGTSAKVIITDKDGGNYAFDKIEKAFTITAKTVTPTVELSATTFEYTGKEIKPTVTVKVGETTIPETEYTVAYSNNTNTGTSAKVIITDKDGGIYSFEKTEKLFTIADKITIIGALTIIENETGKTAEINGSANKGENFSLNAEISVNEVVLKRTFTANDYSTVILPFSTSASEISGGEFFTFVGVKYDKNIQTWVAQVQKVTEIAANKPYIFKPTSAVSELKWTGKTLTVTPSDLTTTNGNWSFKGVYDYRVWTSDSKNDYGFSGVNVSDIKIGEFVHIGSASFLRPFRCYLTYNGTSNDLSKSDIILPEKIIVRIVDETSSVVEAIDEPVTPIDEPETHVDEPEMQETPSDDIETPVSEIVPTDNIKVWSFDKTVIISAKAGLNYKIVDLSGRVLKTSVTESDREEVILRRNVSGIVIVRIGQKSFKIKL